MSDREELQKSFEEAAKPLMRWMSENCDPYATAVVTVTRAEWLQSEAIFDTEDFLRD